VDHPVDRLRWRLAGRHAVLRDGPHAESTCVCRRELVGRGLVSMDHRCLQGSRRCFEPRTGGAALDSPRGDDLSAPPTTTVLGSGGRAQHTGLAP
jgi:hypothetical protein